MFSIPYNHATQIAEGLNASSYFGRNIFTVLTDLDLLSCLFMWTGWIVAYLCGPCQLNTSRAAAAGAGQSNTTGSEDLAHILDNDCNVPGLWIPLRFVLFTSKKTVSLANSTANTGWGQKDKLRSLTAAMTKVLQLEHNNGQIILASSTLPQHSKICHVNSRKKLRRIICQKIIQIQLSIHLKSRSVEQEVDILCHISPKATLNRES